MNTSFSDLVGLTISKMTGAEMGSELICIETACGRKFVMHHFQDCCESVAVADVCGNVDNLIGLPVLHAEESSNVGGDPKPEDPDSWTWTFYRIGTVSGTVVIRWLGESNGYYSESVDFTEVKP